MTLTLPTGDGRIGLKDVAAAMAEASDPRLALNLNMLAREALKARAGARATSDLAHDASERVRDLQSEAADDTRRYGSVGEAVPTELAARNEKAIADARGEALALRADADEAAARRTALEKAFADASAELNKRAGQRPAADKFELLPAPKLPAGATYPGLLIDLAEVRQEMEQVAKAWPEQDEAVEQAMASLPAPGEIVLVRAWAGKFRAMLPLTSIAAQPRGETTPTAPDFTAFAMRFFYDAIKASVREQIGDLYDGHGGLVLSGAEREKKLAVLKRREAELGRAAAILFFEALEAGDDVLPPPIPATWLLGLNPAPIPQRPAGEGWPVLVGGPDTPIA